MSSPSTLTALLGLISSAVKDLEELYASQDLSPPSLASVDALSPSEAPLRTPRGAAASKQIISACGMLSAMVAFPVAHVLNLSSQFLVSSALRTVIEANIVETIRELAGDNQQAGVHVDKIAAVNGMDSSKLARVLRLLVTYYVFREVEPNVFANNRNSVMLDCGKIIEELLADPKSRYEGQGQLSALAELHAEDGYISAEAMSATLRSPETTFSLEPNKAPFNRAYKYDGTLWEWLELEENTSSRLKFGSAMRTATKFLDAQGGAFDWAGLSEGAIVVDVGGGVGAASMALRALYPKLKYVIQDRAETIKHGEELWKKEHPGALESGDVRLEVHDFFEPQPTRGADVYHLRQIMHDWSDLYAVKILKRLREAATPSTRLVIRDYLISLACPAPPSSIPGAQAPPPPEPLPHWGPPGSYLGDIQMLVALNSLERTLDDWVSLFNRGGWTIIKVHRGPLLAEFVGAPSEPST
ncbi:hypothetical protein BOTBODRAFT_28716 [Botryobasidium botryosum FD-172 SS1]|uniref:Uncharacterized protein n=1 Tax=Botryobasidium botryosum (strain FD-172 SS1) TaxID=930990 RepID=A0A067N2E9_BOTB1|nr:hypothetical protein BOTBODRAFT_28716 [Botryobasidium botryosum FD-172 SS1]